MRAPVRCGRRSGAGRTGSQPTSSVRRSLIPNVFATLNNSRFFGSIEADRTMSGGGLKTLLAIAGVMGLAVITPGYAQATHYSHHRRHAAPQPSADDPGLRSASAYVLDRGDSSVWYSHNASVASPIASITKLM